MGIEVVLLQVFLSLALIIFLFRKCSKIDHKHAIDDLGVFWMVILFLYSGLPALSWYLQGGEYLTYASGRLYYYQPKLEHIIYLMNIALAYSIGFIVIYFLVRRKVDKYVFQPSSFISNSKMIAALFILMLTKSIVYLISFTGVIETPISYVDQYRVIQQAPLLIRQVLKILISTSIFTVFVLVVGLFQRWPKSRVLVIGFFIFNILFFDPSGGRVGLATTLFSIALAWHVFVKPISLSTWMISGIVGLVAFTILGIYRGVQNFGDIKVFQESAMGLGEFEAIWSNAVQLLMEKESNELNVPWNVRFSEFWEFIPSQLLPFEKLSPANWYVETYYPDFKARGGGWAFGALAQSIIGYGIPEALIRGMLLGLLLGYFMKWYRSPKARWYSFPLFLNLLAYIFISIRDTTFVQISSLIQVTLPSILLIWLSSSLFVPRRNIMKDRNTNMSGIGQIQ